MFIRLSVAFLSIWLGSIVPAASCSSPSADQTVLDALANSFARKCHARDLRCMDHYAVVGQYALVGYTDGRHRDGMFVARKRAGRWTVLAHGGGSLDSADLRAIVPAMSRATARSLDAAAFPVWRCR